MAKRYFYAMLSEGIEPNRCTYKSLGHARKVYDETPRSTVSLLNPMVKSYGRENPWEDTLYLFHNMISESRGNDEKPDNFTIPSALKRNKKRAEASTLL
ncbi:hypothetical protein TB2_003491 [Malus domestica]